MRSCYICGRTDRVERHHVYGGANRRKSEKHGMVVDLCHWHHNEPPMGVHHNHKRNMALKREFQERFEKRHTRDEFRAIFGKSYL